MGAVKTSSRQDSNVDESQKVIPTGYNQWHLRDFTNVNVRLDLPVGVRAEEVFDGKKWILSMGFHYLSPPPGVLDDAKVFVHVYVERIAVAKMAEELEYQSAGRTEESKKYWRWYYELHPNTSQYDKGHYSYFRRDVMLSDKELLHTHAEVLNAGPQGSRDADRAAVKRILDSIEAVGGKPKTPRNAIKE